MSDEKTVPNCILSPGSNGMHDWCLHKRELIPEFRSGQYTCGYTTVGATAHREVWYCTRCRVIEERTT